MNFPIFMGYLHPERRGIKTTEILKHRDLYVNLIVCCIASL
jgi:hypothetical protein